MGTPRIIAVVPCRAGSERVKDKNTREFAGVVHGLLGLKLHHLFRTRDFARIVVTSDDPLALDAAMELGAETAQQQPEASASTDALIAWIPEMLKDEPDDTVVLWTHVTSPLFDEHDYNTAIATYRRSVLGLGICDSLMTVKRLQDFIWNDSEPVNYLRDPSARWPRTQDVDPLWQVSGAAFMAPLSVYREQHDRIGHHVAFMEVSPLTGIEVDTEGDFEFAEAMVVHRARGETRS